MTQATILVVEDEGIVAQEIKSRLEKADYSVCGIVHDGERAVAEAVSAAIMLWYSKIAVSMPWLASG